MRHLHRNREIRCSLTDKSKSRKKKSLHSQALCWHVTVQFPQSAHKDDWTSKWVGDQYCIPISSTFNFYWDHPKVYKPPNKTWEANKLVLGNLPLGWVHPLGVRSVASAQLWRRWLRHWLITASCRPGWELRKDWSHQWYEKIWELCWFQWCF